METNSSPSNFLLVAENNKKLGRTGKKITKVEHPHRTHNIVKM